MLGSPTIRAPPSTTTLPPATTTSAVPEVEEFYSSWSLFLVCCLLILSLWTSYYLQIKRIRAIHETLVSIFAGMFVGLVVRLAKLEDIQQMLTFKHTLFFNLLLPPIILNSGYELRQANFFRNFGSILIFAFLGTFISAVGVGVLVYIWSFLGLESLELGLLECLIFGSTLSATDPVTILAIFNQYKVDPKLYTIIFGESLLNDAVSIVMYETLSKFHGEDIHIGSVFNGIGIFLLTFSGSMALGVVFGLAMSLILKHSHLSSYPQIESCLVALTAYTCYFFSTGITLSGIVSLLFCGITLKHYAYHTMSRRTQRTTKSIFSTLAQLSENFIFVYLGLSLFTSPPASERVGSYFKPLFIIIAAVAVVFTRYAAVFPLSEAINFVLRHARGQRVDELPHSYQMMLFWAGLRGAVGVALAAGFQGPNAQILRTTVLVVVVLTVVVFGGTTARMLEVLGIRTGVEDEPGSDTEDENGPPPTWARRRAGTAATGWGVYADEDNLSPRSKLGFHYGPNGVSGPSAYNHAALVSPHHHVGQHSPTYANNAPAGLNVPSPNAVFSSASSEYDSDGGEVLPMAPTHHHDESRRSNERPRTPSGSGVRTPSGPGGVGVGEDAKWFQQLDERYLLPLFSNATASRTWNARQAQRRATAHAHASRGAGVAHGGSVVGSPEGSEDEDEREIDLTDRTSSGSGLGAGATAAGTTHGQRPGINRMSSLGHDDSRAERGLASPVFRTGSANGGVGSP